MIDVFEIAERIAADAVPRCGDEISVIAYCGSHATGAATARSDLDLFYIPAEGTSPDAARSFVVAGVTFDFWAVSWETAERIADGRFRSWAVAPGIIANAKVLHARSPEDRARLEALQRRIVRRTTEAEAAAMAERAIASLPRAERGLEELRSACRRGDAGALRDSGWRVVTSCVECLALADQVTFDGGWARAIEELGRLASRPPEMEELVRVVVASSDRAAVLSAAERLVSGTRRAVHQRRTGLSARTPDEDRFRDTYAELHEHLQKLRHACAAGDALRASLESWQLRSELEWFARESADFRERGLPDPAAAFDAEDLEALARVADEIDRGFAGWLEELGLEKNVFADGEELARWLSQRSSLSRTGRGRRGS